MSVSFFCGGILFLATCTAVEETIPVTISPMSQSAPLWSYVNFTCEGIGKALTWVVQYINLPVNLINSTNTSSSYNLSSVLTVQALPDEDGARILCLIFADDYSSLLSATVANLTIKGVSRVGNITWLPESSLLTWSTPIFSSEDITAYNILLEGNDDYNITNNSTPLNISGCGQFVTITAFAGHYMSLQETVYIDTIYYNVAIVDHNVTFDHNMVNASLLNLVDISVGHCNGSIIGTATCNDSIIGIAICSNCNNGKENYYPQEKIQEGGLVQYTMYNLEAHKMYTAVISLSNCFKIVQDKVTISTYYVQNVTISHTNGSVSVRCVFFEGVTTDECHIEFIETNQELKETFNITGSVEVITLEKSGSYTIRVYDLLTNGSIIGPAFELPSKVLIVIPFKTLPTYSGVYDSIITSSSAEIPLPTSSPTTTTSSTARIVLALPVLALVVLSLVVGGVVAIWHKEYNIRAMRNHARKDLVV